MGSIADIAKYTEPTSMGSSPFVQVWTTGDVTFTRPSRAIRATDAGNIKLTFLDLNGAEVDVVCEFAAGETRYLIAKGVKASGTTCTRFEVMV
jgi:hypothetical protein